MAPLSPNWLSAFASFGYVQAPSTAVHKLPFATIAHIANAALPDTSIAIEYSVGVFSHSWYTVRVIASAPLEYVGYFALLVDAAGLVRLLSSSFPGSEEAMNQASREFALEAERTLGTAALARPKLGPRRRCMLLDCRPRRLGLLLVSQSFPQVYPSTRCPTQFLSFRLWSPTSTWSSIHLEFIYPNHPNLKIEALGFLFSHLRNCTPWSLKPGLRHQFLLCPWLWCSRVVCSVITCPDWPIMPSLAPIFGRCCRLALRYLSQLSTVRQFAAEEATVAEQHWDHRWNHSFAC